MKAIVQHIDGAADVLVVADIPTPDIADDEALVRVHAAGVDRGCGTSWRACPTRSASRATACALPRTPCRAWT